MIKNYQLIAYNAVWFDENGQYVAMQRSVEYENISFSSDCSHKDIVKELFKLGFLTTSDMRRIKLESYRGGIDIYAKRDKVPLGKLELIREVKKSRKQ